MPFLTPLGREMLVYSIKAQVILPGLFGAPRFNEMLDKVLSHTSETSRVVLRATRRRFDCAK